VTFLVRHIDWMSAAASLKHLTPQLILLSAGLALSEELIVGPFKWNLVVANLGLKLGFAEALLIRMGSQPIRSVAPLKSGEAASVIYLIRVHQMDGATAAGTVLFEKAVNLWATIAWMILGLALIRSPWFATVIVLWVLLPFIRGPWSALAAHLHKHFGGVGGFAARLLDAFLLLPAKALVLQLPLALLFTFLEVFNAWLLLNALGADVPMAAVMIVIPLSFILNNIPITLMGIGMRESVVVVGLSAFAAAPTLLAGGVAVTVIEYLLPTVVGLFFLRSFLNRCTSPQS
jgi:uncharacterized membrane protein YbhN (UPF0104 family)